MSEWVARHAKWLTFAGLAAVWAAAAPLVLGALSGGNVLGVLLFVAWIFLVPHVLVLLSILTQRRADRFLQRRSYGD